MNIDYSFCEACKLSHTELVKMLAALYDVNCIYKVNFWERIGRSNHLYFPSNKELTFGIGDMHIGCHCPECFPRFSGQFIVNLGIVDGEILETLWSVLNEISPSMQCATLSNRAETLDLHMQDSNWKKLLGTGQFMHTFLLMFRINSW